MNVNVQRKSQGKEYSSKFDMRTLEWIWDLSFDIQPYV